MDKKQLQTAKKRLIELRKDVTGQVDAIKSEERDASMKDGTGDLSGYSFHLADHGTDCNDKERRFITVEREGEILYEIDTALDKIEEGTYGICEVCSRPIGWNRLEAVPYARMCIKCKQDEEEQMKHRERDFFPFQKHSPDEMKEIEFEE